MIEVKYYALVREAVGIRSETLNMPSDATLRTLLLRLSSMHPKLHPLALDNDGNPSGYLNIFIDGVEAHSLRSFDTELSDGDTISIAPTMGGG